MSYKFLLEKNNHPCLKVILNEKNLKKKKINSTISKASISITINVRNLYLVQFLYLVEKSWSNLSLKLEGLFKIKTHVYNPRQKAPEEKLPVE